MVIVSTIWYNVLYSYLYYRPGLVEVNELLFLTVSI